MKRTSIRLVALVAPLAFASCVSRTPFYMNPALEGSPPRTVAVLPVVDRRPTHDKEVDFEAELRGPIVEELSSKGYDARPADLPAGIETDDVAGWTEDELATLLGDGSEAAFVIFLDELYEETTWRLGIKRFDFRQTLTGVLITDEGVVWNDVHTTLIGNGGLIGAEIGKGFARTGSEKGAKRLVETLPEGPGA